MNCEGLRKDFLLFDKIGLYVQKNTDSFEEDRKKIRGETIDLFKIERAGIGVKEKSTRIIYCVEDVNNESNISDIDNLNIEVMLKLIKWLFVEQDITYWSFSGKMIFYKALSDV